MQLYPHQVKTIEGAREALDRADRIFHEHDDSAVKAYGIVGWHLGELLALVGQLTGEQA